VFLIVTIRSSRAADKADLVRADCIPRVMVAAVGFLQLGETDKMFSAFGALPVEVFSFPAIRLDVEDTFAAYLAGSPALQS
jgi:hypothetical protein